MTFALVTCTEGYCGLIEKCVSESENQDKVAFGHLVFDVVAALTLLVVGILGAVSVIGMLPAGAYTMIGIGSAILAADIIRYAVHCICNK